MRKLGIIAVLSLLVVALAAVPALAANTFTRNAAAAPTGTHLQSGTLNASTCHFNQAGTAIVCDSYQLAGVGNSNARADLSANYTATVDCRNKGGKIVPVKASVQGATVSTGRLEAKNGKLTVPSLSTAGQVPTDEQFEAQATCPNGNWTKEIRGSAVLSSFTYTLHFVGFTGDYVTITGP